jgi:glyoxylase I family protein
MTAHPAQIDPKKDGVDLGIIIRDWEASKRFYCDTLGFTHVIDMPFPLQPGTMHRVQAGSTTLKLSQFDTTPAAQNPPGGAPTALGIRYFTVWVRNLADVAEACAAGGYKIPIPATEVRPGVKILMVEDPDGNWVEFLQSE